MKFLVFASLSSVIILLSCGKGYTTKPQIKIESITTLIPVNGQFQATLKFTDKQGDLGGGTFAAVRVRMNVLPAPSADSLPDTYLDSIPDFPNNQTGEFEFSLDANSFHEQTLRNDSLVMKFVVIDRAGNESDTVTSPLIVALYQ
ncbi:MAG TPA: hypothetical protein VKR32_14075 [Puia sp.]|nr:hypothetical protein [Puia sp.]